MKAANPAGVICSGEAISEPVPTIFSAAALPGASPCRERRLPLGDDVGGRLGGRDNADEAARLEAFDALLLEGRDVGCQLQRPAPATPMMRACPPLCSSMAVDSSVMAPSMLPAMTSGISEPPLL